MTREELADLRGRVSGCLAGHHAIDWGVEEVAALFGVIDELRGAAPRRTLVEVRYGVGYGGGFDARAGYYLDGVRVACGEPLSSVELLALAGVDYAGEPLPEAFAADVAAKGLVNYVPPATLAEVRDGAVRIERANLLMRMAKDAERLAELDEKLAGGRGR